MSTLAAFVMTWHRPRVLRATLEALLAQTLPPERILVVDNGAEAETAAVAAAFGQGVGYAAMPDNLGPAGAAAFGLERLAAEGHDWIYWGDDDNPPRTPDTLERLLALPTRDGGEKVGGVGAVGTRWDWRRGRFERLRDDELAGILEVDSIAGGQHLVLRRTAVESVGLPDARLFFGLEELDYCLRLRRAGWRLLVDGELMHTSRVLAGRLGVRVGASAVPRVPRAQLWRRYYSTRNYVFMMRSTFGRPDLARRETLKALYRSLAAWLRGPAYGAVFARLQLRALLDGYRGRLGRTLSPAAKEV